MTIFYTFVFMGVILFTCADQEPENSEKKNEPIIYDYDKAEQPTHITGVL